MKIIEIDDVLYRYIASHTVHIGESASDILRRILNFREVNEQISNFELYEPETVIDDSTEKRIIFLLQSNHYMELKHSVERFLAVLSELYQIDPSIFTNTALLLQGRKRVYFAEHQQTLLKNGTHTRPKIIPNSPYWVITNTNTQRKCDMIKQIMLAMRFSEDTIQQVSHTI